MSELFINMGFCENPFSRYSAEEEKKYINSIYEKPKYYATICSDIESGTSRFLMGDRGMGKSALMYRLLNDLADRSVFSVLVDQYDNIPIRDNEMHFVNLVIEEIVSNLAVELLKKPRLVKKLDKREREKLAFIITNFFESRSKSQIKDLYEQMTRKRSKNVFRYVFNWVLLKPINMILSSTSEYLGSIVNKAIGLQTPSEQVYREYLKELKIENGIPKEKITFDSYKDLKGILREVANIIIKMDYKRVVVFFDQIDEYKLLRSNIENIANFIAPIVTDNSLLYNDAIGFEFVVWNKAKDNLKAKQVRFDKFIPIDIGWSNDELLQIISKRLSYFAEGKQISLEDIVGKDYVNTILNVSSGSPRNLIILLHKIYLEQASLDENVKVFSEMAVQTGLRNFCANYEYEMLYPESQIKKSIDKIMKVNKVSFEIKDLVDAYKVSSQSGNSWVKFMMAYGLIEETDNVGSAKKKYRVIDEKLVYLINNNLKYEG